MSKDNHTAHNESTTGDTPKPNQDNYRNGWEHLFRNRIIAEDSEDETMVRGGKDD